MTYFRRLGLAAILLGTAILPVSASTISATGNFTNDNDVVRIAFTVPETVFVTFQTFGYGGGTNAAGQVILPGGFESMLHLFDQATGNVVGGPMLPGPDPVCGPRRPDPNRSNFCFDVFSQVTLDPGAYYLAVTQSPNTTAGTNLADGFIYDLDPNFAGGFVGTFGFQGDSHWAADITFSPEPDVALLIAPALLLIGLVRRRRSN